VLVFSVVLIVTTPCSGRFADSRFSNISVSKLSVSLANTGFSIRISVQPRLATAFWLTSDMFCPVIIATASDEGAPIWIQRLDLRVGSGMLFRCVGRTAILSWICDAEQRPLDYLTLPMLADTPFPRVMVKYAELRMTATVSLSVYFHASAEEITALGNDFVMIDVDARRSSGDFFDQMSISGGVQACCWQPASRWFGCAKAVPIACLITHPARRVMQAF
jgi:hypothetical protein